MNSPANSALTKNLNLNQLRVFTAVYRSRSMTVAAKELHLTQSGVSQHMKSLEGEIGIRLFDRVKQRLVPTTAATGLYHQCMKSLHELEEALLSIKGGKRQLQGKVTVGMPIEFGNNIVIPHLTDFSHKHQGVKFKIIMGYASDMIRLLLEGRIDFCFIDEFPTDERISTIKVYEENLDLVISPKLLKKYEPFRNDKKFFESLPYVDYKDDEPLLRMWFKHHFNSSKLNVNVKATLMDVQGVGKMVLSGMGAGVVPDHYMRKINKGGKALTVFKGCGRPLINKISLACLKERSHSPEAASAMEYLVSQLK